MRTSWAPTLVPETAGHTYYLVIEQYRDSGLFPETTIDRTELDEVLSDLAGGQYSNPLEVIAFNPTEGWSENVSGDIANELQRRADLSFEDVSSSIVDFVERHTRRERQLALRLV